MLGEDHGLGRMDILTALEDDRSRNLVLAQEAQVRLSGVTGVPVFLVNKRFFLSLAPSAPTVLSMSSTGRCSVPRVISRSQKPFTRVGSDASSTQASLHSALLVFPVGSSDRSLQ